MDNSKLSAYPFVEQGTAYEGVSEGMSKLEAFTMAAMQGLCGQQDIYLLNKIGQKNGVSAAEALAKCSVEIARATLSELSKQK